MNAIPYDILIKIFYLIDNPSKHLLSKYLRTISILTMPARECRKRIKYNLFNIEFITLVSKNLRSNKRSVKFNEKKNKWKLHMSYLEILFKMHLKLSKYNYIILEDILNKCYISDELYDKIMEISVLYESEYLVKLLLDKVNNVEYSFTIAYDHKYFYLMNVLYEYKRQDGNYILFSHFNESQRSEFKRIFIDREIDNPKFRLFESFDIQKLIYYTHSIENMYLREKLSNVTDKLFYNYSFRFHELTLKIINDDKHANEILKKNWNKKKIKSFMYRSEKRNLIDTFEISAFNFILNHNKLTAFLDRILLDTMLNFDTKIYNKLLKDVRVRNFIASKDNSSIETLYKIIDSFILRQSIHTGAYLEKYLDELINEIQRDVYLGDIKFNVDLIVKYIESLKVINLRN